jgi:hypothetical protein
MTIPLHLRDQSRELRADQLSREAIRTRGLGAVVVSAAVGVQPDGMLRGIALDED